MSDKEFATAKRTDDSLAAAMPAVSGSGHRIRPQMRNALALTLLRHEVHSLRRRFEEFERDILLPILLGEIALHNIGALESANGVALTAGECLLRPCNTYSIAAAINLPRETVRRKVARLVAAGWIERLDNGHLFVTAAAMQHFGDLLLARELPELLQLAEDVRSHLYD